MVKIEKENSGDGPTVMSDREERYPWGTSLRFENKLVDQLDLSQCQVGEEVTITAKAFIDTKSVNESSDSEGDRSIGVQLTEISVMKPTKDRSSVLYGEG